jgi:hypothetical protein
MEIYIGGAYAKKSHLKILYTLGQKRQISNKKIYYLTTILILFTIKKLFSYIF